MIHMSNNDHHNIAPNPASMMIISVDLWRYICISFKFWKCISKYIYIYVYIKTLSYISSLWQSTEVLRTLKRRKMKTKYPCFQNSFTVNSRQYLKYGSLGWIKGKKDLILSSPQTRFMLRGDIRRPLMSFARVNCWKKK